MQHSRTLSNRFHSVCSWGPGGDCQYVCGVHVTCKAFIFMCFPSNDHIPEPTFKLYSVTIRTVVRNEKFPGKSRPQVLMAVPVRRPDMLKLQLQTSVALPSFSFPTTQIFLFLFLLYCSYFQALLFSLHLSSSPSTQLLLGMSFLCQGLLRLWKALP